jgi:hypothetical protein
LAPFLSLLLAAPCDQQQQAAAQHVGSNNTDDFSKPTAGFPLL